MAGRRDRQESEVPFHFQLRCKMLILRCAALPSDIDVSIKFIDILLSDDGKDAKKLPFRLATKIVFVAFLFSRTYARDGGCTGNI